MCVCDDRYLSKYRVDLAAEGDDPEQLLGFRQCAALARIELLDGAAQFAQVLADAAVLIHRLDRAIEEAVRLACGVADLLLPHRRDRIDPAAEFGRVHVLRDQISDEAVDARGEFRFLAVVDGHQPRRLGRCHGGHRIGWRQDEIVGLDIGRGRHVFSLRAFIGDNAGARVGLQVYHRCNTPEPMRKMRDARLSHPPPRNVVVTRGISTMRTFSTGLIAALLACSSSPALAQAVTQGEPTQSVDTAADDIVVTAQKREQRIEDVPVTVTALTGARLADIGINSLSEAALFVPGLRIQEQSANNPGIVIRGITSDSGSAQQGARVTLYYNGVDISRSRGAYQDLYDIQRLEVVKGPQATLFGTAAAIGAVSIVPNAPRAGTSAGIVASYGNFNRTQVSGYLNAGNDVLAGRLAFAYKYRDGYVRNIAGDPNTPNQNQGKVDQDDLNGQDQRGIRGSIRFAPTDAIVANLVLTYDGQRNPGTAFKSRAFAPTGGQTGDYGYAELSGSPFSESVLGARRLGLKRDVYDANFTLTADLAPGITFTTVNGYRRFKSNEVFDADGGPAWYLEFAEDARGDQWSHESRFAFTGRQYRASFGFNAFFENGSQRVPFSTEEGTYLACSVTAGFAGVRAALNAAGIPTGPNCVAPNGTIPGNARDRGADARRGDADPLCLGLHQLRQQRYLFGVRRRHVDSDTAAGIDRGRTRADRGSPVGL